MEANKIKNEDYFELESDLDILKAETSCQDGKTKKT